MTTPENRCDLVMKGGITSGVVYPLAVAELSKHYRFQNIGGTSAGAIAAAVTAAAEYGRDAGGFDAVRELPDELSAALMEKFQPQKHLRPLFALLLAGLSGSRTAILRALVAGYWTAAMLGAAPGIVVLVLAVLFGSWGFAAFGILVAMLGAAAGAGLAAWRQIWRDLPRADYGLCGGLTQEGAGGPALTDWLADTIDRIAGRAAGDPPLGIGDLAQRGIVVRTVTTDLTTQRPYELPMRNNLHFFSVAEFRKLFPARVVDYMVANSSPAQNVDAPVADLHYFRIENMPLVVLARMSLSFPGLISAVPLWRNDFTLTNPGPQGRTVRCLFSDGGISSNFPVHFFDTFLPHTPTFGISLGRYDPGHAKPDQEGKARVVLPVEAGRGQLLPTRRFSGLGGFVMALFDSAKDWQDSLQSVLTGYRDRIVTVNLSDKEGGLNLDMPPGVIAELTGLGEEAGRQIVAHFDLDEHRWRRFLVEVRAIDEMLRRFADAYDRPPPPGASSYPELAVQYDPKSYRELTRRQREAIREKADRIAALGRELQQLVPSLDSLDSALPTSRSRLRSLARMDD